MSRRYLVRTYGCQMNEHDSERIAGLLEADGLVRADSEDDADVVVLNTCCIRENADNKLYGNLGHLKTVEGREGRSPDRRVRMPRPEGPDLVASKAGHVDVVMGTHNVHRAAELLREAAQADAPAHRDPRGSRHRRSRDVPVRAAGPPGDVATTRG